MQDKKRKIISTIAAFALTAASLTMAGCSSSYTGETLGGDISGTVVSNGGFVVEKGDYVYFINGSETYTAENVYGKVEKGSLMRIKKSDLDAGNYENTDVVVPLLISSQNKKSGFYIYGDYVYFATPTSDKDLEGNVASDWIDFKRAKLDGSETMKDYFFRLETNSVEFRYVEVDEKVYCMYVDDGALYSYDVEDDETRMLVKGAAGDYTFNSTDPTDANVYYTMNVTYRTGTEYESEPLDYTQLYVVNASATATVDADNCAYTVTGGKTYGGFDAEYLEENDTKEKDFDVNDYTTYPYVNLGTLVLDGIGSDKMLCSTTQYNNESDLEAAVPAVPQGYTYTVKSVANSGVYFTRTEANTTPAVTPLYYLAEIVGDEWNTVSGNATLDVVKKDTATEMQSELFLVNDTPAGRTHTHIYVEKDASDLFRATVNGQGEVEDKVKISEDAASVTLDFVDGNYLYMHAAGTNGNNLVRLNYTGEKAHYDPLLTDEEVNKEYATTKVLDVDWTSSWFTPEIVDGYLFYADARSVGTVAYNYVNVISLKGTNTDGSMKTTELTAINEKYADVEEFITEKANSDTEVENVLKYYFRTGKTAAYDAVKAEYDEDQQQSITEFMNESGELKDYLKATAFYNQIGVVKAADQEAMDDAWANSLIVPEADEENEEFPVWAIVLLSVAGGLIVAAAITVPVCISVAKKKKLAQDREKTRVKKHIDTTDDKSIDVYATEEEPAKETSDEE